jgi:acyl carrier protein
MMPVTYRRQMQEDPVVDENMSGSVAQKVIEAIAKAKRIPVETVTLDSTLAELKIDSLDGLNLFFDLEEVFNLSIPDDKAKTMRTVKEIVEGLEQLIADKNAQAGGAPASN